MFKTHTKLTQHHFEYYILQIDTHTLLSQIESKLSNLRSLDTSEIWIVLSLSNDIDLGKFEALLSELKLIIQKLAINLYGILPNQQLGSGTILSVPIVNLPSSSNILSKPANLNSSLIIDEPIRNGVRIESEGDIIITTFVSDNAEIIANGNIHVYGEARGRLIAGHNGNKNARIFVVKFNAELVSIAGIYKTLPSKIAETIGNKPVMVKLDDKGHLNLTPLPL